MIDVAAGDDIPRKRGLGIVQADLLVVNKIDLAPHVGADLERMRADLADVRRTARPCSPTSATHGAEPVLEYLQRARALRPRVSACIADGLLALRFARGRAARTEVAERAQRFPLADDGADVPRRSGDPGHGVRLRAEPDRRGVRRRSA